MTKNVLTILGSSSALPTSERFSTAQVLQMLGRFFLIDCGEGTQMQLRRVKVPFNKIQAIFISHLHGDHYLGIFGVLSSFNLLGRTEPLVVYGPENLEEIVRFHLKYIENNLKYDLKFKVLLNEPVAEIYVDKKISITAFKVNHGIPCWGFRFQELLSEKKINKACIPKYSLTLREIVQIKEGSDLTLESGEVIPNSELTIYKEPVSYAFVTDTIYKQSLVPYIKQVSLLYHEATYLKDLADVAHKRFHSTAEQAALIAHKAEAKKLVIGHFSARYKNASPLLDEALSVFENTELAEDLKNYEF